MINSRKSLIHSLQNYQPDNNLEESYCKQFLNLLESKRCYFRDHLPAHITGSAWIIDESRQFTLLTHHAKLQKWLQPGGHADGDENILQVALREAEEETGIRKYKLITESIFDIDIHTIPTRNNFPEHFHFDIRFAIQASTNEALTITEESTALQWIAMNQLANFTTNASLLRMSRKTMEGKYN